MAVPTESIPLLDRDIRGNPTAPVALLAFSDFECPFCGRFSREVLPKLQRAYVDTGEMSYSFRNYPLPAHEFAEPAAEAGACAGDQGHFWEMHNALFADQSSLDHDSLVGTAARIGLDRSSFAGCIGSKRAAQLVDDDKSLGKGFGVFVTPTFFLGRRLPDGRVKVDKVLTGVRPLAEFASAIEGELKVAR